MLHKEERGVLRRRGKENRMQGYPDSDGMGVRISSGQFWTGIPLQWRSHMDGALKTIKTDSTWLCVRHRVAHPVHHARCIPVVSEQEQERPRAQQLVLCSLAPDDDQLVLRSCILLLSSTRLS